MSQTTTPHTSGKTRKTAFAVGAVLALVGIAFAATMYVTGDAETLESNAFGSGSELDPVSSLTSLSAPLPGLDGAASGALAHSASVQGDAAAQVDASVEDAQARVDAAAGQAGDILAGTDGGIEAYLAGLNAYNVQDLQARLGAQSGTAFLWNSMPSTVVMEGDEVHFEQTGHAEVDEALLQAEAIIAQIQAMYGSAEVQTLFATADQTAGENGVPVRVPGLVKSPFGAESAVEPDEDGALIAKAHAEALLGTVDGGYGTLLGGLQQARATQTGLAGEVDGALAAAAKFRSEASAAVDAEHKARVDAVAAAGAEYEARLSQAAEAYLAGVESAAAEAEAGLDAELAAQLAAIENGSAEAQSQLDAHVDAVRSEADARLAGIAQAEADVRANAGAISAADAEAFFTASAAAKAQIEAQVAGAESAAAELKGQISAEAEARKAELESTVAAAHAELEARVDESRSWAEAQVGMLQGDVDGALASAIAVQGELRSAAKTGIDQAVVAHKAELKTRAYAAVADARAYAETAQATVEQVQGEAYAEVGNDLRFIGSVADDYGSVPTPERQAAADAWMLVQAQLDSSLGAVLVEGSKISAEASAVAEAAAQAEAALGSRF